MFTEDKVTKIFCIADDFCNFFDAQMKKYVSWFRALPPHGGGSWQWASTAKMAVELLRSNSRSFTR